MRHRITHYDTLGIKSDATAQEIRTAFRKLTRQHHPDHFTGVERATAEQRFQAIAEAFNVLSRPASREDYDHELSVLTIGTSSAAQDPKELSRRLSLKGGEELKLGRIPEALDLLKLAVDHDDNNARAHYLYGYALSRMKTRERDGLRHLERAVTLEPNNSTFKAEAALVCLAVGLTSRAARLAEDALALDPTSQKATAVLSKARAGSQEPQEGLLNRLRRKG
jgi:curved DNA-binding protein CbpA